jgi:hypothetical protein
MGHFLTLKNDPFFVKRVSLTDDCARFIVINARWSSLIAQA